MFVIVKCANLTVSQQDETIVLIFLISLVLIFNKLEEQDVLIFEFSRTVVFVEKDVRMLNE